VVVTSYDGYAYAIDATKGTLRWKFQTGGERRFEAKALHGNQPANQTFWDPWDMFLSSPVIGQGAVFFGSGDGNVYALDQWTGAVRWKFKTGDVVHSSPAYDAGTIYVGSWDSYLYALEADEQERTPPRRQRGDRTKWEDGWEVGNHGNRSDLLPFKIGSADAAAWYSGYLAGRARRANTARGRRLERAELCVRSQNTSDQK